MTSTPPVSHRSIVKAQEALGVRLETAGQLTDQARENVMRIQRDLEDATRELVRLEANEAQIVRELEFAWEAQADFESMELDRHHAEAEESLKAANDRLSQMAEESWDEDGDALPVEDEQPDREHAMSGGDFHLEEREFRAL